MNLSASYANEHGRAFTARTRSAAGGHDRGVLPSALSTPPRNPPQPASRGPICKLQAQRSSRPQPRQQRATCGAFRSTAVGSSGCHGAARDSFLSENKARARIKVDALDLVVARSCSASWGVQSTARTLDTGACREQEADPAAIAALAHTHAGWLHTWSVPSLSSAYLGSDRNSEAA